MSDFFERQNKIHGVSLNTTQQLAVETTEGPLLLLACPGSGKTTTLIMRIGYLIEEKRIPSNRIKAITFSRAAANEMKLRYETLFPKSGPVSFSTIHSLAFTITSEFFRQEGISFSLIEGEISPRIPTKTQLLREIYKNMLKEDCTDDQVQEISQFISLMKNNMTAIEEMDETKLPNKEALNIFMNYEAKKMQNPSSLLLDFDDLLVYALKALIGNKAILERFSSKFDYLLTDESQDTSRIQHAIIEQLVKHHQNICVVADDDQAIYTWRAADPKYLLTFKNIYPNAVILKMEQNYRSSSEIVFASNELINKNKKRYKKSMFTENPTHSKILIKQLHDDRAQMRYVIYELLGLKNVGNSAILFRNNASAILYISELERRGIPFYMKDVDQRFFSHWIVEDMLNFMRLSFNLERKDVFLKVAKKFNLYLSNDQINQIKQIQETGNVFHLLSRYVQLRDYQIKSITAYLKVYDQMKDARPKTAIRLIREELGYNQMLINRSEKFGFRMDALLEILGTLEQIAEPLLTMEAFAKRIKELDVLTHQSKKGKDPRAVTLSTFHSAKGLEFDRVYMVDLLSGIIPSEEDMKDTDMLEEARRLFYVGMTRARHHLELLTYSTKDDKEKIESRFVSEVRGIVTKQEKSIEVLEKQRVNPNLIMDSELLVKGLLVIHPTFGEGQVVQVTEERVLLQFKNQQKELFIATCIEKGLLTRSI